MKISLTLLCAAALAGMTACNLQGLDTSNSSPSVNSQEIEIPTQNGGYQTVPKSSVTQILVRLYPNQPMPFNSVNAQNLLNPISFNDPVRDGDTGQATGEITIDYTVNSQPETHLFYIVNGTKGQFVEDSNDTQIHYRSSIPLDFHWVSG